MFQMVCLVSRPISNQNKLLNPLHAKYAYMRMGVVKKKEQEKEKKTFHSWDRTRDFRIGRLVSYPLGHQGSWVFHAQLCSYSFVNRLNYDTQIKHSACKGLSSSAAFVAISTINRDRLLTLATNIIRPACITVASLALLTCELQRHNVH